MIIIFLLNAILLPLPLPLLLPLEALPVDADADLLGFEDLVVADMVEVYSRGMRVRIGGGGEVVGVRCGEGVRG